MKVFGVTFFWNKANKPFSNSFVKIPIFYPPYVAFGRNQDL